MMTLLELYTAKIAEIKEILGSLEWYLYVQQQNEKSEEDAA